MARVLLVEDDPLLSRGIVASLSVQGYSVDTAFHGKSALTMANDQPYAIVILDIGLPDISGFDVLRKLKTPKFEQVHTVRTAQDRKRFARIASAVLNGIDAGIYRPQPNWMCADCGHADACRAW